MADRVIVVLPVVGVRGGPDSGAGFTWLSRFAVLASAGSTGRQSSRRPV
jgi:hypothetical protein